MKKHKSIKVIKITTLVLLSAGVLTTGFFMLDNGEPDTLEWWPIASLFFAWSIAPYVGVAYANEILSNNIFDRSILLFIAIIITIGGIAILIDTFIIHLDPQSGLVFIFLPIYQGAVVIFALIVRGFGAFIIGCVNANKFKETGKDEKG